MTAPAVTTEVVEPVDSPTTTIWAHQGGYHVGRLDIRARELPYGWESTVRYAEIVGLSVEEQFRRQGAGSALVRHALRWAAENGYEAVSVAASARPDRPGLAFYERVGFTPRTVVLDIPTARSES